MAIEELKSVLLRLPREQRAEIAQLLADSLEPGFFNADYDADFRRELERRFEEIRNGTAIGIPTEEVFAKKYG